MREVVIAGAARTAIGGYGGSLAGVSAADLGVAASKAAMERAKINMAELDEVLFGNVVQAGLGQNVARQISFWSGVPKEVPATTINKVCGSGLRTVSMAAQLIKAGDAQMILAGGTENMSRAPYLINGHRFGVKMGNDMLIDSVMKDGLLDVYNDYPMGITAENVARQFGISREDQDAFALKSQNKAQKAIENGRFKEEIVPVPVPQRKGDPVMFDTDEYPRMNAKLADIQKLRPAFKKEGGTVTAGNSSGLNDGAAALVVCSREKAEAQDLPILAIIRGYGSAGVDPAIMGIGVVPASQKAMKMAGITVKDLDLVEANEAFAAQSVAAARELGLPEDIINVNGGAIALGHPIGCSGARILVTLLYEMQKRKTKYGLAALCIGGGMGTAMVVEGLY